MVSRTKDTSLARRWEFAVLTGPHQWIPISAEMTFLVRLVAIILLGATLVLSGCSRCCQDSSVEVSTDAAVPSPSATMRAEVLAALRPSIRDLLLDIESKAGLQVEFQRLPEDFHVGADYGFDPYTNTPKIRLRGDWQDVDVAHELTHTKLELVESYYVLAWRRGVEPSEAVEAAMGRVRSYVDDEVVHARLARSGYRVDGEILKPSLFDSIYTDVARYLAEGRPRQNDGMAHLDAVGYGDLCRVAFLVQAELILQNYHRQLPPARLQLTRQFIDTFRKYRKPEADQADKVLALFEKHDVQSVAGHKKILQEWAQIAGLDQYMGVTSYRRQNGRFILPWP